MFPRALTRRDFLWQLGGGGTPDKFRIKIWDKNNNNAVVYDTQPGAPVNTAPTTALGGGRIQVHTNAQLVALTLEVQ
jgi:hypothetical protein